MNFVFKHDLIVCLVLVERRPGVGRVNPRIGLLKCHALLSCRAHNHKKSYKVQHCTTGYYIHIKTLHNPFYCDTLWIIGCEQVGMPWAKISFRQNRNWICDTEIFWGLQGKIQYQIQFDDKKQSFADGDEDDLYKGPICEL